MGKKWNRYASRRRVNNTMFFLHFSENCGFFKNLKLVVYHFIKQSLFGHFLAKIFMLPIGSEYINYI